ncbi:hypothetical protein BsWGS_13392 [Bradybaena similaris]
MSADDADFHSSVLGTQKYWEETYSRELKVFHDVGDTGEIWFGEEVQDRIVQWLTNKSQLSVTSRILDIGCGNGMLLLALRSEGFTDLTGVDYSEGAVSLSRSITQKGGITDIKFEVCDILLPASVADLCRCRHFDVCLDKGTYDAISLRDAESSGDRVKYSQNVQSLLSEGGHLIITSCNWTKEQLELNFQSDFDILYEIPAPSYTFGGKTGQTVTTLVLKKKPSPDS